MSRSEWEGGLIKIPRAEWVAFRKALLDAHNAERERMLKLAQSAHHLVLASGKGKRNFDWTASFREVMRNETEERHRAIEDLLWPRDPATGKRAEGKPMAPKKKLLAVATRKTTRYVADCATIMLNDKDRTVRWSVSENNHACESSRSSTMGRALFAALDRVKWGRGSGGQIVGNDENNMDNDSAGGGGNYVTAEYGPNVKRPTRYSSFR